MIKLRKHNEENHQTRFYLLQKTSSASPDYVGLQVIYGVRNGRSLTRFFWFKNKQLPSGRLVSASQLLKRKVRDLVLRRLRSGYILTRKSDAWCRIAVAQSLERASRPKRDRPPVPPRKRVRPWERLQLAFDFC